jgi:nucleobase:cation symporter-1, NCS1 family
MSIEKQGIEFVPLTRRYGTPRRLFTIWFSANLSILCLTVGTLGITGGLSLSWCLLGLVIGNAIGTAFMAAHSAQGPHLGIPQMIQSRAQFGVLGASIPLIAVVASAVLYTAANGIIIRDTLKMILPLGDNACIVLFGGVTVVVAFVGYELIHKLGATLSLVSGALFLAIFVLLLLRPHSAAPSAISAGHFSISMFLLTITQSTAWSLSSSPIVADYSRYLPASVSVSEAFWYTAGGNFLSSVVIMGLGAYMASEFSGVAEHPGTSLIDLFPVARGVVAFLIAFNLLQVNVMNLYSAFMSSTTIVTSLRSMTQISLRAKLALLTALMTVATAIAIVTQDNFAVHFSDLLSTLVYVLIPWSAINLADYYVVQRGSYAIEEMFSLSGLYGSYNWKSIGIYLLGIVVQIPFWSLSFYEGPAARLIGADVSWIPGLLLPAILYCRFQTRKPILTVREYQAA